MPRSAAARTKLRRSATSTKIAKVLRSRTAHLSLRVMDDINTEPLFSETETRKSPRTEAKRLVVDVTGAARVIQALH
jgi:hypothetical protein